MQLDDHITLIKIGTNFEWNEISYIFIETAQGQKLDFGLNTETTKIHQIFFTYPLVGIETSWKLNTNRGFEALEKIIFFANSCTDDDPDPLVLEYLTKRYVNAEDVMA